MQSQSGDGVQAALKHVSPFSQIERILQGVKTPRSFWFLGIAAAVWFALLINNSWNASPDSALYLALGHSLASGAGYVFNGEPHTYVAPGFPSIIAAVTWLAGRDFWVYRFMMSVMGLAAALLSVLVIKRVAGPTTAWVLGPLCVFNYTLFHNSAYVLADVPFAVFALVALLLLIRLGEKPPTLGGSLLTGASLSVLPLIRINGLGFIPSAAFFLLSRHGMARDWKAPVHAALVALTALLPFIAWLMWKSVFPASAAEGSYFNAVTGRMWSDQARIVATAFVEYFSEATLCLTGLSIKTYSLEIILPLVAFYGAIQAFIRGDRLFGPLTAIQGAGLLLSTAGERYLLFLLPTMFLFLFLGLTELLERFTAWSESRKKRALLVTAGILLLCNMGHGIGQIYQARTPLENGGPETERSAAFFTAAGWLREHDTHGAVLSVHSRVIHFLAGNRTIALLRSGVPEHETWVDADAVLGRIFFEERPTYVFWDGKNAKLYSQAFDAARRLGIRFVEILEASSPPRYKLLRVIPPESGLPADREKR